MLSGESIRWKGRDATRLVNDIVELIILTDGGHLAEFQFLEKGGFPSQNVLWEAPWMTSASKIDPFEALTQTGGFTGHALCLDYFGTPLPEDIAAGLPIHGEAGAGRWDVHGTEKENATCRWSMQLPVAQLRFEREIRLGNQENVAYVKETVENGRDEDHACHWVQHAAFSPPFLDPATSAVVASAARGITSPSDYEGGSLLTIDREFLWPYAPRHGTGRATVDLRKPFSSRGLGFGAGVQLDPTRKVEFLLAMNWSLRLGVGYCFRREDFPWMSIWEENCTRPGKPWNGTTEVRGMEFGTTPLPLGHEGLLQKRSIFDMPTWCVIPANGKRTARYLIFLFTIPAGLDSIQKVEAEGDAIVFYDANGNPSFSIPAHGCEDFLGPN